MKYCSLLLINIFSVCTVGFQTIHYIKNSTKILALVKFTEKQSTCLVLHNKIFLSSLLTSVINISQYKHVCKTMNILTIDKLRSILPSHLCFNVAGNKPSGSSGFMSAFWPGSAKGSSSYAKLCDAT